jgi:peroxiredoxin
MSISKLPDYPLYLYVDGELVEISTSDLFSGKRVVFFSPPGAFTPVTSDQQLPGFEDYYQRFVDAGVDDVYCICVNDPYVMYNWGLSQGVQNVKLISDGNGYLTGSLQMLVQKMNVGENYRSWRYAALVDDCNIEWILEEPGKMDNCPDDPYVETTPQKVLERVIASDVVALA